MREDIDSVISKELEETKLSIESYYDTDDSIDKLVNKQNDNIKNKKDDDKKEE